MKFSAGGEVVFGGGEVFVPPSRPLFRSTAEFGWRGGSTAD